MADKLDAAFGIHPQALKLRSQRLQVLASNIANADTPGFKARDLDFQAALRAAAGRPGVDAPLTTHNRHIADPSNAGGAADGGRYYRTPLQPSLDGNTVDPQLEHAAFGQAALEYQATLSFMEGKVRSLMTAITGE